MKRHLRRETGIRGKTVSIVSRSSRPRVRAPFESATLGYTSNGFAALNVTDIPRNSRNEIIYPRAVISVFYFRAHARRFCFNYPPGFFRPSSDSEFRIPPVTNLKRSRRVMYLHSVCRL